MTAVELHYIASNSCILDQLVQQKMVYLFIKFCLFVCSFRVFFSFKHFGFTKIKVPLGSLIHFWKCLPCMHILMSTTGLLQ